MTMKVRKSICILIVVVGCNFEEVEVNSLSSGKSTLE